MYIKQNRNTEMLPTTKFWSSLDGYICLTKSEHYTEPNTYVTKAVIQ